CSATGNIQLNCKLLFLTPELVDHVLIHELCHLRHHNHGPAFRELLLRLSPATTELEQQLKAKASLLAESNTALQTAQSQLLAQQSQLSTNATELEQLRSRPPLFSFQNNSSRSNIAQDQLEVKAVVSSAYDTIQAVYGQPYLLNQITIQFVDSFSIAGSSGEIVISNGSQGISIDIKLKAFSKTSFQDVNTLIHEIVHGFHGVAVLDSSALEEGITVAATDVVMEKMIQAGNLPRFGNLYITLSDEQYAAWNTLLSIKKDNNAFYGYSEVSKAYQLVGKAWLKLYQTNPSFFSQFNSAYYPKIQQGQKATDRLALETISSLVKTVDGQSISQYLSTNQAFNPS
ncbi:MAG: M48 family metallopeptidase, partial [Methanothrix sp.]